MPRNGSGVFSLPSGYLAVTGQTILASQHNPPLEDIATALTGSLPVNGSAGMQAALPMGGNQITGMADGALPTDGATVGQASTAAATAITTAPLKVTPVDADSIPLVDSAAGNTMKRLTWANLKALFQTASAVLTALSGIGTAVSGDIIYASGAATWARKAKGTDGQVLTLASGLPAWATASGGAPSAVLEDQKSSGTGGGTSVASTWTTHILNTEVRDPSGLISLSSNQFTSTVAGWVEWEVSCYTVAMGTRLQNITDGTTAGKGMTAVSDNGPNTGATSMGGAAVVASKAYALQYFASAAVSNGLGPPQSQGIEVYARVKFYPT